MEPFSCSVLNFSSDIQLALRPLGRINLNFGQDSFLPGSLGYFNQLWSNMPDQLWRTDLMKWIDDVMIQIKFYVFVCVFIIILTSGFTLTENNSNGMYTDLKFREHWYQIGVSTGRYPELKYSEGKRCIGVVLMLLRNVLWSAYCMFFSPPTLVIIIVSSVASSTGHRESCLLFLIFIRSVHSLRSLWLFYKSTQEYVNKQIYKWARPVFSYWSSRLYFNNVEYNSGR